MTNTAFRTFRELRDAINTMPEGMLDEPVFLNMDNGRSLPQGGGTLDLDGGRPFLIANGD